MATRMRISKAGLLSALLASCGAALPLAELKDHNGAVASESTICSNIGIELLNLGVREGQILQAPTDQQQGNAADALVGTVLCVGVIGMYHSGIGGGGFMLVRDAEGQYESIDFRETAPASAHEDMFKNYTVGSIYGGMASGIPGEIAGLEYLHDKHGSLPWQVVVHPAVHVARYGFPVTADLVRYMNYASQNNNTFLTSDPLWAEDFAPNGTLLGLGDTITRKRYADTLEKIAFGGARVFYVGEMAEATVAAVNAANGSMTPEDMASYNVSTRAPVSIHYRGHKLISTGAPSSGSVALATLKTIEGYNMSDPAIRHLNTHRFDEALRFAYAAHNELGDPEYLEDIEAFENEMLSDRNAEIVRGKISDKHTQNVSDYDPKGFYSPDTAGTSHVVTADKSGMSVTLTTTINLLFGSQVMVPETGIIMNNEMNDFSIPGVRNAFGFVPSPANFIRPGKRPLSSITPVIAEYPDGSLYISTGAAGGSRIITATVQALWHVLDHDMNMPEALAQPRLHDQLMPNNAFFETTFDAETIEFMRKRGHNVTFMPDFLSSAQGIRRLENGTFEAAGEPRQKNSGGFAI